MWEKTKFILSSMWLFMYPLIKTFMSEMGPHLAKAALAAVKIVAQTYGQADGNTKRKAAFDMIVEDLAKQGLQAGASTINAAIEVAVQKMKSE